MPLLLVLLELALTLCLASACTHCSVVPSGTLQVLNGWLAGLALQRIALNVCQWAPASALAIILVQHDGPGSGLAWYFTSFVCLPFAEAQGLAPFCKSSTPF